MINQTDDYFSSEEFHSYLNDYEQARMEGRNCILSSDELTNIAEYYFVRCEYSKAKEVAEYAIFLYPDSSAPLTFLAQYQLAVCGDQAKALDCLKQANDKSSPDYQLSMLEYYLYSGETEKGVDYISTAMERRSDESNDDADWFLVDVSNTLMNYRQADKAERFINMIANKDSEAYMEVYARWLVEEFHGDEAIELYNKLIDRNPFNISYWNQYALAQTLLGHLQEAIVSCGYALAINEDDITANMQLGNAHFKCGHDEEAIKCYQKVGELKDDEIAELYIGKVFMCGDKPEEAYKHLKIAESKCTDNKNNRIDLYHDLAVVCGLLGNQEEAIGYVNLGRKLSDYNAYTYITEGGIYLANEDMEKARIAFAKGLDKASDKLEYQKQMAVAYYEYEHDIIAYCMFKYMEDMNYDKKLWLTYLAACCNNLGLGNEFLKYLEMAIKELPKETMDVLSTFFPTDMDLKDYLEYAKRNIKTKSGKESDGDERDERPERT